MLTDTTTLLTRARKEGYAVGAFNIYNLEGASAVVQAAESMRSPVMLQLLPSALQIGGKHLVAMCLSLAEEARVPVGLHLDHCPSTTMIHFALDCGIHSIMADGSELSFEENIAFTKGVFAQTRKAYQDGAVEAELGKISGMEDGEVISAEDGRMTDPDQAMEFVKRTKISALAVCVGNIHGKYPGPPQLDFARLNNIADRIDVPLVLHGTSGLPDEMITRSIEIGVCKFNVNTEVRSIYLSTLREKMSDGNKVELIDLMRQSIEAMKQPVRQKIKLFQSEDKV